MSMDPTSDAYQGDLQLSDLAEMVQNLLRDYSAEINKLIESTIARMKVEFSALLAHYDAKLKLVQERMEQIEAKSQMALDSNQSVANDNKLLICGVPEVDGENLRVYFSAICSHLSYPNDHHPIVHLTRMRRPKHGCRSNQPILIEFALHGERREFFAKYLRTRSLSQKHLGFTTNNRIFINEFLSTTSKEILTNAVKMKRDGKLMRVYTKEGIIHAVTYDSKDITIQGAEDLRKLDPNICK